MPIVRLQCTKGRGVCWKAGARFKIYCDRCTGEAHAGKRRGRAGPMFLLILWLLCIGIFPALFPPDPQPLPSSRRPPYEAERTRIDHMQWQQPHNPRAHRNQLGRLYRGQAFPFGLAANSGT